MSAQNTIKLKCIRTVSLGWTGSSFSVSLMRKITNGYAKRGGAPNTIAGFGDLSRITFSNTGF